MSSCSGPTGGLRKQIISQLCVLNISNTSPSLINFFAKKNQTTNRGVINHKDEIFSKIKNNSNLKTGQTVLSNITRRSSQIINHLDDKKIRAVFSDIPIVNDGIMKKVNEKEKEEIIRKISAMTVGMNPKTVQSIFDEVEERNNGEIDPKELAKIKQLITNMFDYKSSLPSSGSEGNSALASASNMMSNAADTVANAAENAKSEFTKRIQGINVSDKKKQIMDKLSNTSLKGGNKHSTSTKHNHNNNKNKTSKHKHNNNNKNKTRNKTHKNK